MGSLELLRRLLAASARLSSRRPCTVLAGALLVTLAAAWPAVRTLRNIESNLVEVLTAGLPRAETYKRIARDFGVIDRHYLVVEAADPADLPAAKELASRLAAALSSDPGRDGRLRSALDGDTALAARLGAALDGDCGLAGRLGLALGRSDGLADRLALALPGDPGLARDLAAVLGPDRRRAARLARALPMVRSARARLDLGRFLRDHAQLYLDAESAAALAARFSDEGLARAMERNARLLEAGTPWQRVEADPLDLASLLPELARRRGAGEGSGLDPDGFMVSADRRMVLVSVLATQSAGDRGFTARLMEHSRETVRRESGEFFSGERAGLAGRLSVEIGGAYAAMEQHGSLLLRGLLLSSAGALAVILLMFAVAYRRASSLLFVGLPLLAPVVWTLAAAPLLLGGRLSILGAGFAAVLLGLGIDFAVHLYNRYVSARAGGLAPAEAAEASVNSTGEGIVIGALTTVAAFAGMALTSFRGLTEFGVMAALGVGLSMVGLLAVLPAALVVISRRSEQIRPAPAPSPFGLGLVARMVESRPGALLALGGLVMAAGLAAACVAPGRHGLGFESDFAALGPPREVDTSGELNRRVARAFGQAEREVSVVVRGADAGEVMARTAGLRERARALAASGAVGPMRSILDIVPSPAEQERSLTLARALPLGDLPARLDRAAVAAGFRAGSFARFGGEVGRLAEGIRAGERLDPGRIPDPALAEMAGFFFAPAAPDRPVWQTNSRIALPAGRSDPDVYGRLGTELGVDGDRVRMTSHILMAHELRDSVAGDVLLVSGAVLVVVLLTLWLALRRPLLVVLAASPVAIGAAVMLVFMRALAIDFNYVNVLALPILAGIGVDNAVHLIVRARQDGAVRPAVLDTGRALVLCSLTTIWGFLSLYVPFMSPPHWGMRSLGLVTAAGMAGALLGALFFVPAALVLLDRRKPGASGGGG